MVTGKPNLSILTNYKVTQTFMAHVLKEHPPPQHCQNIKLNCVLSNNTEKYKPKITSYHDQYSHREPKNLSAKRK